MQGGPFGEKKFRKKFRKKCLAVPKKIERGDSLVSPGLVCYAEKQVKPFWFSSLDQIVHFGAIIFCRTFVELFWSVRVDRKKRFTIIVAFHFMKRRLKKGRLLQSTARLFRVNVSASMAILSTFTVSGSIPARRPCAHKRLAGEF